ncbi:MAG: RsmB/NOP family class I SAM-dependent RNA methyltransferase [Acidobacteria bacterium]|nr:RsmB/NOP family class I SAM-dependent RNA methyltransferase [Acidobacteriota bacterium]
MAGEVNERANGGGAAPRSPRLRAIAIGVLAEIEAGAWSDRLLAARERRLRDSGDRARLHALVYATLRWAGAIDARLRPLVRTGLAGLDPRVRAALRLAAAEIFVLDHPAPVAVDSAVHAVRLAGVPAAAGLVNAVLRRLAAEGGVLDAVATMPAWLVARWRTRFGGEAALALIEAANRPARPFAVARGGDVGWEPARQALARDLAAEGVATAPALRHPGGLVVTCGAPQTTAAFGEGRFVLVDEAAALVALLATPDDSRPIADLAAAPGGKAALIAQRAAGPLVALEPVSSRAARLAQTIALRAPAGRAAVLRGDALSPPLARSGFGCVLLDAPCSGTGTLRRRPDKRHRLAPTDIADCAARQARMLEAAAPLVATGGALVYAVCSLEPEEGEEQLRSFLTRHRGFAPVDPAVSLGGVAEGLVCGDPPALVFRPDRDDLDGFFAARLERVAA